MLGKLNLNVIPKVNYLVYDKTEIQAQDATQEQKSSPCICPSGSVSPHHTYHLLSSLSYQKF